MMNREKRSCGLTSTRTVVFRIVAHIRCMFCDYCSSETCVAELGDQASLYSPTSLAPIFDPVYSTRVHTVTVGIKTSSTTIQAIHELMYTIQTLSLQTRMGWVGVCASRFLGLTAAHSWEPVSLPPVNLRLTSGQPILTRR